MIRFYFKFNSIPKIIIINFISILTIYMVIEISYRFYLKKFYSNKIIEQNISTQSNLARNRSVFDIDLGYRYKKNLNLNWYDTQKKIQIRLKTNSFGHMSDKIYKKEKDKNVFRIGVIGDSFTANVTNTLRWTDLLQDKLNLSNIWNKKINKSKTEVLNFALDGVGVIQFNSIYFHETKNFDIDLLIINMIKNDVLRRFYYRGKIIDKEEIKSKLNEELNQINWFKAHPEVIAVLFGDFFKIEREYSPIKIKSYLGRFFRTDEDAALKSSRAIQEIIEDNPNTLIFIHPTYQELINKPQKIFQNSFNLFQKYLDHELIFMKDQLLITSNQNEYLQWYNWPLDAHPSDFGLKIYAESIKDYLINR